jgi:hypothetical protein
VLYIYSVTAGLGLSANVELKFVIPSNASYGYVSTITVSVGSEDPTAIENFYLLYLTVERPVGSEAATLSQVFRE